MELVRDGWIQKHMNPITNLKFSIAFVWDCFSLYYFRLSWSKIFFLLNGSSNTRIIWKLWYDSVDYLACAEMSIYADKNTAHTHFHISLLWSMTLSTHSHAANAFVCLSGWFASFWNVYILALILNCQFGELQNILLATKSNKFT